MIFRHGEFLAGAIAALLLRATIILLCGWLIAALLRRARPASRHLVWVVTLAATVGASSAGLWLGYWAEAPEPARLLAQHVPTMPVDGRLGIICLFVWLTGVTIALAHYLRAIHGVTTLTKNAVPIADYIWQECLLDAKRAVGVTRMVALRSSTMAAVPIAWGWRHPVIVVPASALPGSGLAGEDISWTRDRSHAVLLHELAHVKRGDCATDLVVRVATALLWFHPGVWISARMARLERELECDLVVVQQGVEKADYAQHLVDILRTALQERDEWAHAGMPMIGASHIEMRLRALSAMSTSHLAARSRSWLILLVTVAAAFSFYTPDIVPPKTVVRVVAPAPNAKKNCKCPRRPVAAKTPAKS